MLVCFHVTLTQRKPLVIPRTDLAMQDATPAETLGAYTINTIEYEAVR